jgi:hypothetical protein
MPIFMKLQRWWWLTLMEVSRWLLVVLFEAFNDNFLCVQVVAFIKELCSYYSSSTHALVLATLLLHVHSFILHLCCAFVFIALLLHTHMFLLHSYCAFVLIAPQLHVHLFLLCFSSGLDSLALLHWVILQLLTLLRCYHALFINSWPSCVATMHCSSIHDPLALLPCTIHQFMTLLHCYHALFINSWPSCVATMHCSSIHDPLALLWCATP